MSDELLNLRNEIDRLDAEILERLAARARHALRVGEIKEGNLYRPEREAQVLRRLAQDNPGPLPDRAVQRIFREIMSACLALEQPLRVAYPGRYVFRRRGAASFRLGPELPAVADHRRGLPRGGSRQCRIRRGAGGKLHRGRGGRYARSAAGHAVADLR